MLRITHTQVAIGPHLITDIDDGLTRQTAKRGTGDPKRSQRDGSVLSGPDKSTKPGVNYLKQKCYLPRVKAGETSVAGYIDLKETDRVLMSQGKGCINGLRVAGHITVTSFTAADVAAPTVATAQTDVPGAGDLTITGTNLTSLAPDITSVVITGTGAKTLTQSQITTGGGTVSATSIVILAALIPGVDATVSSVQVRADAQLSSVVVVTV
jgi:hypothetical protein